MVDLSTRDANVDDAIEVVNTELLKMAEDLVTSEELEQRIDAILFYSAIEDSYNIAYWGLNKAL